MTMQAKLHLDVRFAVRRSAALRDFLSTDGAVGMVSATRARCRFHASRCGPLQRKRLMHWDMYGRALRFVGVDGEPSESRSSTPVTDRTLFKLPVRLRCAGTMESDPNGRTDTLGFALVACCAGTALE